MWLDIFITGNKHIIFSILEKTDQHNRAEIYIFMQHIKTYSDEVRNYLVKKF